MPAGLGKLSAGLQALVDFLEIDEDLIAVAAASSPAIQEPRGLAEWVSSLSAQEKEALLARVAAGEGAQVQALLLRRFRAASGPSPAAPGRTAAELWQAAGDRKAAREKAAEERRREAEARRAAAQAAVGAEHLDQLATRTEAAWEKAAKLLDAEYAGLARQVIAKLARKRPSPLLSGRRATWAAAVVYALGQVNFLFDPSREPCRTADELSDAFGVAKTTMGSKAKQVRDMLKMSYFTPEFLRADLVADNPGLWFVEVDGLLMDARSLPLNLQTAAYRLGCIPYIPALGPEGTADLMD